MLEKSLEDMKNKIVIQDDESDKKYKTEIVKLEALLNDQIDELSQNFENFKKEKKDLETQTQTTFMDTQSHNNKMLEEIEALYEKKLTIENQKYFEL